MEIEIDEVVVFKIDWHIILLILLLESTFDDECAWKSRDERVRSLSANFPSEVLSSKVVARIKGEDRVRKLRDGKVRQ